MRTVLSAVCMRNHMHICSGGAHVSSYYRETRAGPFLSRPMAAQRRRPVGGYDCEFVAPPPEAIQTECPVCLQIPREPCVISCPCGKEFCLECIERIKDDNRPCPLCNLSDFTFLRHYGSERYLKAQEVWCSHKKDGCKWRGKLGEYEQHLNEECPLTEIHCPLHYAGCGVSLPRKDMPDHMNDTVTHMTLLATVTQSMQQNIEDLKKENQELRQKPDHMSTTVTHMTQLATVTQQNIEDLKKENQELRQKTHSLEEKQKATEKEVEILREETHRVRLTTGVPVDFHMKYEREKISVFSPSFYTHLSGYQMCIELNPNGCGDGKGTHVSVFTYFMRGPYDDHLKWPFRGKITVQIVNQAGDHSHVEKTIPYNNETRKVNAGRVIDKERGGGLGFHQFLPLTDLHYNAAKKTQYLKDDIIIVRVVSVKITQ